ncbi:MAG TPA: response regulator [Roseiflexaceae bacterium]
MGDPVEHPAIVVVDDDRDTLNILRRLLDTCIGLHNIISACTAAEALNQIERQAVALVITDYCMPDMNGLQLTAAIKERDPETRVVLMTGRPLSDLQEQVCTPQADYYLAKPFSLTTLERIVYGMLA